LLVLRHVGTVDERAKGSSENRMEANGRYEPRKMQSGALISAESTQGTLLVISRVADERFPRLAQTEAILFVHIIGMELPPLLPILETFSDLSASYLLGYRTMSAVGSQRELKKQP
jgi:hypothetical protein